MFFLHLWISTTVKGKEDTSDDVNAGIGLDVGANGDGDLILSNHNVFGNVIFVN